MNTLDRVLEKNMLPDFLIRFGIRKLLKERINQESRLSSNEHKENFMNLVKFLKQSPLAVNTTEANEQHYEVPTEFFKTVLGQRLKYSCGYWEADTDGLDSAEENMLALTCKRANITDGEEILELGCGWGSLSLYMAEHFPNSKITAVSNSSTQKEFIDEEAKQKGFTNLQIITSDMNQFDINKKFDRVVSVEMFEHMRNYEILFQRISKWLKPEGELFVHIFSNQKSAYLFEVKDETDWMSKYFFTGGIMPNDHLLLYFSKSFELNNHWVVNGEHYQKTARAWLNNMDENKKEVLNLFEETYGKEHALKWFAYWRIFFMSCEELWGYQKGNEWFVSHYLFKRLGS
ncbi:MAG: cyclopropane-fatty-acyl-phospholipid synthase family protein [Bacteroidetes bacterium]|nr:cyclopropane-fatty-acyl-phospholipid synthase family protein [Bacteroidota bacterium]